MPGPAVSELLTLLEASFRGDPEHSLLGSLWTVDSETWAANLGGEGRTIREIAQHAATALHAYYEAGFGKGPPSWDAAEVRARTMTSKEELIAWATKAHERFLVALAAVSDEELDAVRPNHGGEMVPTRNILTTVIAHGFYHGGEINHLRAVLQGNDRWGYWGEMMPSRPGG